MSESKPMSLQDFGELIEVFKRGEEPCSPDYQLTIGQVLELAAVVDEIGL